MVLQRIPIHGRLDGKNNQVITYALVDLKDADRLNDHRWHLGGRERQYAVTRLEGQTVLMHRLILGQPQDEQVRHRNGHPLDNRRSNLYVPAHEVGPKRPARSGISKNADPTENLS